MLGQLGGAQALSGLLGNTNQSNHSATTPIVSNGLDPNLLQSILKIAPILGSMQKEDQNTQLLHACLLYTSNNLYWRLKARSTLVTTVRPSFHYNRKKMIWQWGSCELLFLERLQDVYKRQEANSGAGILFPSWIRIYVSYILPFIILIIFVQGYLSKFFPNLFG